MTRSFCAVEGCPKIASATVYCQMHYRRFRLYGDVNFALRTQRRHFETSRITILENFAEIELTQGRVAKVDLADVPLIEKYNWYYSSTTGYAYNNKTYTSLHQVLLGKAPVGFIIDHADRDKLNCQRYNIKFVTHSVNARNSERSDKALKVSYHRASGKYQAYIHENNTFIYIGVYKSEREAITRQKEAETLFHTCDSVTEFKLKWKKSPSKLELKTLTLESLFSKVIR